MIQSEITAHTLAHRFWERNKKRITEWITEDLLNNNNEPAEFSDFAAEFQVNPDVTNMTLEVFVDEFIDFLDGRDSITSKLWNYLQMKYDSLLDEILSEEVNDSDEAIKSAYYRSVL